MGLVNTICTMLSFGSVAALAIFLAQQEKKKLEQRNQEVMSTISAIQYSQLKGNKHGTDNRDDGIRSGVLICANDTDDPEHDHNRSHKCN